ncbi:MULTISPECIES: VOC family protein [Pseudescherichia]|uniref:VOC family protein n=1 Tax=Pseudescherichia TaxID=2055880 RepID=UPI00301CC023
MVLQHMRIARPVSALSESCEMYCNGLGLDKIGDFTDHDGFSGYMLGLEGLSWHLEFTQCHDHPVRPSPSNEDLLVLYIPDKGSWLTTCNNMDDAGFARVKSFNPYWDRDGVTFKDMDGYRVVIQNMHWDKL